ncbi:TetR/AcrR family transcriptional regulator [Nocardia sp.]|uniref:TetR/AcrR family transcriptional regulator n=1 Tax=Nocardia sp. TaxID=1821 RepID=UPI00261E3BC5|nr:TetR/AcrR family transcriptional regulator [Nocardia sp.]
MTTRSQSSTADSQDDADVPMGRTEVVAAVLTHAADLFAERGPAATSIRDIATRSGVNHGLIFRHFGAKDQLVAAVLDYLGAHSAELIETKADREVLEAQVERQWKVLARAILDGYEVGKLQQRFPTMSSLVDQVKERHDNDRAARLAVANTVALEMGWRLFEPFLRSATGLQELSESELREAINAETKRIIEPH